MPVYEVPQSPLEQLLFGVARGHAGEAVCVELHGKPHGIFKTVDDRDLTCAAALRDLSVQVDASQLPAVLIAVGGVGDRPRQFFSPVPAWSIEEIVSLLK